MKIGIFLSDDIPPETGGGYSYIKNIVNKIIADKSLDITLILKTQKQNINSLFFTNYIANNGRPFLLFFPKEAEYPLLLKTTNKISKISRIKKLISTTELWYERLKAKIEHENELSFGTLIQKHKINFIYYIEPMVCYSPKIPFITTVWDLGHLTAGQFPELGSKEIFKKREYFYRNYLPVAKYIFAESNEGKKNIVKFYQIADEKINIIPLFPSQNVIKSIDSSEQQSWLEEKKLKKENFLFYPAQFWAHKNHDNLLKALKILKDKFQKKIPIVFTGSDKGNLGNVKMLINKLSLQEDVFYLGFVSEKEITILYQNAFALVMPTFLGPTNMPILEAITFGCPIVCSDFEGHREQADNAALYFDPTSPMDIASKINSIMSSSELRNQLISNCNKVLSNGNNNLDFAGNKVMDILKNIDKNI